MILTVFVNSGVCSITEKNAIWRNRKWSVFDHREKYDIAVMTDSTSRHAEFELATNTTLSDFPNVRLNAKSKETV